LGGVEQTKASQATAARLATEVFAENRVDSRGKSHAKSRRVPTSELGARG
jgi:hypothetical protein